MASQKNLEKRFQALQKRLDEIEAAIPLASELVQLSERMNIPLNLYQLKIKQMVLLEGLGKSLPAIAKDDISKAIIQSLLSRPGRNISGITKEVAQLRGKASRRIIAERLGKLARVGIVEARLGKNNEKVYRLRGKGGNQDG
jgi:hypothetical protein